MESIKQVYCKNIKRELGEIEKICNNRKLVIWGTGLYGRNFLEILNEYGMGKDVVSFCDTFENNIGKKIGNLTVFNYKEVKNLYSDNILFLICSSWWKDIEEQLSYLEDQDNIYIAGVNGYLRDEISLRNWHSRWNDFNKELFDELIYNINQYLQDEESKNVLCSRINLIKTKDWNYINDINIDKQQYFLSDFYKLTDSEIYVDLGAWNGDTVLKFANSVNRKYTKIIAFEPLIEAYNELKSNIERNNLNNIDLYNLGSWSEKCSIGFNLSGFASSVVKGEEGGRENSIDVEALDNLFIDVPITFIKMDIEGSEKETIFGAKEIIKKYKPKLAVCVYHKFEDIYEIPKIIKDLVPEYKIYLRHHSLSLEETVCYACI